jgi:hypothetical protein
MTLPLFIDPGFLTGVCGILMGLISLLALRKHCVAAAKSHAEWSGRIEQLELRAPNPGGAALVALGIGRREMRLIAEVSRTLALK